MSRPPDLLEFHCDGATLGALRWPVGPESPIVLAIHGITSNAWSWDSVAHRLGGRATIVALDLRGRGRSYQQPGPFGMRRHADDIAAVIDRLGGPMVLAGHSMGAYAAMMTAERHPAAVAGLVLVDGGTPLVVPDGVDVDAHLEASLGPAIERLSVLWPNRISYRAMWTEHPAFADGIGPDLERDLLADLVEVEGGFRTAVDPQAVRHDGRELLADEEVRSLLERVPPATIIRAPFGLLGAPPPLIPDEMIERYHQHRWVEADGLNHYTVLLSPAGARLVADEVLAVVEA